MGFEVILGLGIAGLAWNYLQSSISDQNHFDKAKFDKEIEKRKKDEEKKLPLLDKYRHFFDNLFSYSLSIEQRMAIVDEANASLAIASAGSGKTSILKGKYAFLIESGQATQQEILVMAFNNNVKNEIIKDLELIGFDDPNVETFHSFGKSIAEKSGIKFKMDPLAEEDKHHLINNKLIETLLEIAVKEDPEIKKRLTQFKLLCPSHSIINLAKDEFEYNKAMKDYPYKRDAFRDNDYQRPLHIPAIDGKTFVKSQEELLIINYLIANGINVEYEKSFPNAGFNYKPDFYLPEADMWFEHFGIDREGNSPFGKDYIDEYKNKKNLHQRLHTNHFFTYSYQVQENKIIEVIDMMLKKQGIEKLYLSQHEIDTNIQKFYSDTVNTLIAQSIKQAKANQYSTEEIKKRYDSLKDQFRASKFKKIFISLLDAYKKFLENNKTNDFEDMIIKAASILANSEKEPALKYKFILVDEFQDLSISRERLLENIITYHKGSKLFAVGDDWQSIYRFTGSDIGAVTKFEEKFPMLKSTDGCRDFAVNIIKRTHRFEDSIAKLSSNFIQKNPSQIQKTTVGNENKEDIPIQFFDVEEYSTKYMLKILKHIPIGHEKKKVYFLARSNFSLDNTIKNENVINNSFKKNINWKELQKSRPDLTIHKDTIHGAKGLEKDIVIILGNDSGSKGFPNFWGEDPLFSVFLPQEDSFLHAEERRVMYVAMTRTKSMNFFVSKDQEPSVFITEIKEICDSLKIKNKKFIYRENRVKPCPECIKSGRTGWLMIKTSNPDRPKSLGYFNVRLACNLYNPVYRNSKNYCEHTEEDAFCPKCISNGKQVLISIKNEGPDAKLFCKNHYCSFEEDYFKYHSRKGFEKKEIPLNKLNSSHENTTSSLEKANKELKETFNKEPKFKLLDDKGALVTRLGTSVHHSSFGQGTILKFDFSNKLVKVQVNFVHSDIKWLIVDYAKLKIYL